MFKSRKGNGLWIDEPMAQKALDKKKPSSDSRSAILSLMHDGLAVVKGANDPALCQAVIEDYHRYVETHKEYVSLNLDTLGREKRLVNFHLWSKNAALVGSNPRIMEILDLIFDAKTAIYSSLTFKYGTQQPAHRDSPHFATWPPNRFVGVWTALETVNPLAGPLFYHTGAHRFKLDPHQFFEQATKQLPNAPREQQLFQALELYNGEVIRTAPNYGPVKRLVLDAGDTVIWHPQLPHGGSPADNPAHTRWSIVFHCSPANVQVHQHDRFFTHLGPDAPPPRYGFIDGDGIQIANSGEVAFM